ncbi:MAG TPA: S9 family peptidase [Thermomicrobiales bacterium]|nr:S9 family peptidase [Thermomicrobiales bacterium]
MPQESQGTERTIAPYGAWRSPITTEMLTAKATGLREPGVDGDDLLWIESLANEGGRSTLVRRRADDDAATELTPAPFNVRSRVHEYGGGAWAAHNGLVIFSNYADNRLYRIDAAGGDARPITPEGAFRYADLQIDAANGRLIAVREDHSFPEAEAINTIVILSLEGPNDDGGTIIVSGADFVASPRLNAAGDRLAWMTWNHPAMPWDASELWTAELGTDHKLSEITKIAGGPGDSASQPRWLADGSLVFVAERSGWWNLYRARPGAEAEPLHPLEAEFGVPQWVFGQSTWDIVDDTTLVCAWTSDGTWSLGTLDLASGQLQRRDISFTSISDVHVQTATNSVVFLGGSSTEPSEIARLGLDSGKLETIRRSRELDVDTGYLSIPEAITWQAEDGTEVHGFYYAPTNKDYAAPAGALPPVIVESHGGPTGATSSAFSLATQFWTSRGFGILDVNYGGSTGYGRAYRERLRDNWGIVDIDDCVSGVQHLVEAGKADPNRLVIRGGSAGGYTTLAALAFRRVFSAGASYYGIGDLEALAKETHKFESRYLDGLVGPYPQAREIYVERSPIHHVDRLSSAMILFQGLDDMVVPPNQARMMADAVREKGLPVALFLFEGEGHGFRKAENTRFTLEAELSFYAQLFGFTPADEIEPIVVENLVRAAG